jgi:hypothetical protein
VYWATEIERSTRDDARQAGMPSYDYAGARVAPAVLLEALATTSLRGFDG